MSGIDTTGIKVGDPDPWPNCDYDACNVVDGYVCTAPIGHIGPHVAAGISVIRGVWEQS